MSDIKVGQKWRGVKTGVIFTVTKVTEKSVSVKYEMPFEDDYGNARTKEKTGILTKKQLTEFMELVEE